MDIEKSHESFERIYDTCWRYYRELEHSLAETRRYVAFDESNFSTFSLEYLRIILATCGEVDTVGKCLAEIADPEFVPNKSNILNCTTLFNALNTLIRPGPTALTTSPFRAKAPSSHLTRL